MVTQRVQVPRQNSQNSSSIMILTEIISTLYLGTLDPRVGHGVLGSLANASWCSGLRGR